MKKSVFLLTIMCLFLLGSVNTLAQPQTPPLPPKILRIYREDVKPGMGAAHEKVEVGWPKAFAKAKYPIYYLAMTSMSGPNEAWFIEGHESFAAIENAEQVVGKNAVLKSELDQLGMQDSGWLSGARTLLAVFNEELSYRAGVNVPQMRYFTVATIRVRPGLGADFTEQRRLIKAALEKAQADVHFAVYQVISGAPSGTYLVFTPMKSLSEMEPNPARTKAYQEALGEENRKKVSELASKAVLVNEPALFAFSPKMSYLSKEFMAADPAYWNPKPAVTTKKELAKKGTTQ